MRLAVLIIMILLSTAAAAYEITEIARGTQPVIYGDTIAFLTFEDAVDEDLNGDGDMTDNVLQFYSDEKVTNTLKPATKISLFRNIIAFEDKSRMVHLYDINTGETTELKTRGITPSIYGKYVAFVTSEGDADEDLNEDNDAIDDIIRYYNRGTEKTTNTNIVGTNPIMLENYLVFQTRENLAEKDLNGDGDKTDMIIRALDIDAEEVLNTKITGETAAGYKHSLFIIKDEGLFWTYDISEGKKTPTNIAGNDPAIFQDFLIYERSGELYLYNVFTKVERELNITGTEPAIFGSTIVFVDEEKNIAILKGEDEDEDTVPDFADNCKNSTNTDQKDKDKDGIGDACDELFNPKSTVEETEISETNQTPELTAQATEELDELIFTTQKEEVIEPIAPEDRQDIPTAFPEPEKDNQTFWFLVAVGLLVIGTAMYLIVPRWIRKKKKSYGF